MQNNYQPNNVGGGNYNQKPNNYLALAIISTILCCVPFGVVSIAYASQVDSHWNDGRYASAQNASENARTWFWVSFGVGIIGWIVAAIYYISVFAAISGIFSE